MSDEETIDADAALRSLAKKLRRGRPLFFAWRSYNLMWDAVCWCDELPWRVAPDEQIIMSAVLNHRTAVNLGKAGDSGWENLWDAARAAFPWWVGFWPSRNEPTRSFKLFYLRSRRCAWRRSKESSDGDGTRHDGA